jgi:hypothetical protein
MALPADHVTSDGGSLPARDPYFQTFAQIDFNNRA